MGVFVMMPRKNKSNLYSTCVELIRFIRESTRNERHGKKCSNTKRWLERQPSPINYKVTYIADRNICTIEEYFPSPSTGVMQLITRFCDTKSTSCIAQEGCYLWQSVTHLMMSLSICRTERHRCPGRGANFTLLCLGKWGIS